jgi:hypothetical protein
LKGAALLTISAWGSRTYGIRKGFGMKSNTLKIALGLLLAFAMAVPILE